VGTVDECGGETLDRIQFRLAPDGKAEVTKERDPLRSRDAP
jgi:hypothetical protein